ncbi:MAG TPA: hypothetical protein VGQ57_07725 [Polyangiaceae bacterium]|nr:hypothetical protein [Polyangiaceae bacterium]
MALLRPAGAVALCLALATSSATAQGPNAGVSSNPTPQAAKGSTHFTPAKPAPSTQVSKSSAERGVNPCNTPDPGFGGYDHWVKLPTYGQLLFPRRGSVNKKAEFDVVFHFHGHEPARKEWVQAMHGVVFVGVTLGNGSGVYENTFRDPAAFEQYLKSVEAAVAEKTGRKDAHARRIALTSWSAGYGAIEQILRQPLRERVDSVVLLDGLHCDYAGDGLVETNLEPFARFAHEAADGKRLMVVSHSSIIPPGYASTTETAEYLIHELGGRPHPAKSRGTDPMGLDLVSRYDQGGFHVRGYAGNAELDHCAQVGLYRDILKVHLIPRWNSPRATRP